MTWDLLAFLVYFVLVVSVLTFVLIVAWLLGARTRHTNGTDTPFESGIVPVGSAAELRLSVRFYLVAMFFVIFDMEAVFLFAWAVAFYDLGWRGYVGSAVFIGVLLIALVYEWRTGALEWGVGHRLSQPPADVGTPVADGEPCDEPAR